MKILLIALVLSSLILQSCTYQQIMAAQTAINGFSAAVSAAQRQRQLEIMQQQANQPQVVHVIHHNAGD